jgi:dTDP-4-dehydrorhamnose reductase
VFDGKGIPAGSGASPVAGTLRPYREDDPTNPIGVYGLTKRDGERDVMENNPRSCIIRTAWLYGKHGGNFVHTMLRLMNERDEVKVVNDQQGSPTWAHDLAEAVVAIVKPLQSNREPAHGIYHFTNEGSITWFDFAREIYDTGRTYGLIKKDCAVKPCTSAEFQEGNLRSSALARLGVPARVKRPAFSVLDKTKIQTALGIAIPAWDVSLRKYLKGLAEEK